MLLGVVSFDILPEIFELAQQNGFDGGAAMIALVVGFLLFHSLEKFLLVHPAHEADYAAHHHPEVGVLSALALIGHSFMDGVGIGLAFQVSTGVGITVAIAVIAHDFSDGLNTVSLMLRHRNSTRRSAAMLALDALAPVLGAASTLAVQAAAVLADALPRLLRRLPALHRRLRHPARGPLAGAAGDRAAADRPDLPRRGLRLRRDGVEPLSDRPRRSIQRGEIE